MTTTLSPSLDRPTATPRLDPATRWGGLALIGGGLLFTAGNLLHPLVHDDAAYAEARWETAHLLVLAAIVPLLLGLPVLYQRLRAGGASTSAVLTAVLTVVGFVAMAPGLVLEAFLAPEVGHAAMERFEEGGLGAVGAVGFAWVISLVALSFACRTARLGAPVVRWSFLAAAVALLAMGAGEDEAAGVVIIAATALYGVAIAIIGATLLRSR